MCLPEIVFTMKVILHKHRKENRHSGTTVAESNCSSEEKGGREKWRVGIIPKAA